ncbi:site-specific DNA-methyltransferase [Burkholderia sp. AU31624]|uniref:site-specific DNA-methyltransferase n=1 Tax=Burkholderia sp. AU31624 TaxID=2879629 RepID=UPI001CF4FFEB|nr:site-specific DNA-methyltransferase [Burkholderia sp. AU31624]MCA8258273.1 site-specific DNA-methyltransferase [Burkholderia sp. AU31624]
MKKQRLELTWLGKDARVHLEPRILVEDTAKSYHASERVGSHDIFDNRLIFGDNLLALKALETEFSGRVKCVFIDPPYNTGSAFTHYDDGIEHSLWLSLMRDRLELIERLLSDDGSLWITIDDNEAHYLKVLCDQVFGRSNFIANVVWQKAYTSNQTAMHLSNTHDHILVYAKDVTKFKIGKISRTEEQKKSFSNHDNDPRGDWKAENLSAGKFYSAGQFPITGPKGEVFLPPKGRYWRCNQEQYEAWLKDGRITFGKSGEGRPMLKKFLAEMKDGLTANTWWTHEEVGSNKEASIDLKRMFGDRDDVFQNPKPEKLIWRILTLATNPGDLVLDSFAGSGTTGAVAHKMGRRWIMAELGEHCHTHIIPRLTKVIDGDDSGGITEIVNWKGGGGFRYYKLAPSLLEKDKWGNWVIQSDYNPTMLAEAVCKLMGFTYAPSEQSYWMHGHSSEHDFIYVTTQSLTHDQLRAISEEVGDERSLLVCCKAFNAKPDAFLNLTIKKIPLAVLRKCEWGRDDYSLTVQNLPEAETEHDAQPAPTPKRRTSKEQADLFAEKE